MQSSKLHIYNSLTRQKEVFEPIQKGYVGLYVCGPTVYSDVHLGNVRTFVSFDLIYRYLLFKGYRVRYVRNITDVGHLEGDADSDAEDKISKKARLEKLEPMEVVQQYMNGFEDMMRTFNTLPPSIEPRATGHIVEQIEMVQTLLDRGYAYEKNGSVYFDTEKFAKEESHYGQLSGRRIEELLSETRDDLKNQEEKKHPSDFAVWIKADPRHLMRWPSPWSVGFPGWHLECSAMSTKYLGKTFDIHGGGADLKFPHHENEMAQNFGVFGCAPARYWMHTNMLLMNGKKMSKSDGNTITPEQLIQGDSPHVSKGYSPMVVRFFMMQSHYSSTLDLTDEALLAAEKGYQRLMEAHKTLQSFRPSEGGSKESDLDKQIQQSMKLAFADMDDDFNSPKALSRLFELVNKINALKGGQLPLSDVRAVTLEQLQEFFRDFIFKILGLREESAGGEGSGELVDGLMDIILDIRLEARQQKDWSTSDKIRDALKELNIIVKDSKEGSTWRAG
jgi:cysteinyl-tRNA synthetase